MQVPVFYGAPQVGVLLGAMVCVNAGRELAKADSLAAVLSPGLIFSFELIGIFPLAAKKEMARNKGRAASVLMEKGSGLIQEGGSLYSGGKGTLS